MGVSQSKQFYIATTVVYVWTWGRPRWEQSPRIFQPLWGGQAVLPWGQINNKLNDLCFQHKARKQETDHTFTFAIFTGHPQELLGGFADWRVDQETAGSPESQYAAVSHGGGFQEGSRLSRRTEDEQKKDREQSRQEKTYGQNGHIKREGVQLFCGYDWLLTWEARGLLTVLLCDDAKVDHVYHLKTLGRSCV